MDDTYGLKLDLDDANYTSKANAAAAATHKVDASMGAVTRGSTQSAMGLMALSNAIDDVQYGFRGVVNNIPQIVAGLGFGMGVAGAAQIAGVAINQLIMSWDDLAGFFQSDATKIATADMNALAAAAEKVAKGLPRSADMGRSLEAIGAAGSVQMAMMTAPSAEDEAYRKQAKEAFASAEAADVAQIVGRGLDLTKDVGIEANDIVNSGFGGAAGRNVGVRRVQVSDDEKANEIMARFSRAAINPENLRAAKTSIEAALGRENLTDSDRVKLTTFLKKLADVGNDDAPERIKKAFSQFTDNLSRGLVTASWDVQHKLAEKAEKEAEKEAEKKARADEAATKKRISAQERENADRLKSWQDSPEHQQAVASDAMNRYNEAAFAYSTAGNPNMARLARQQQANARRFGGPGTAASMMQRQMAERMAGGAEAIAQREKAQEVMREASMTFKEAVEKLARDGIEVRL